MLLKFPSIFSMSCAGLGNNSNLLSEFSFIAVEPLQGLVASSIHSCSVLYDPSPASVLELRVP